MFEKKCEKFKISRRPLVGVFSSFARPRVAAYAFYARALPNRATFLRLLTALFSKKILCASTERFELISDGFTSYVYWNLRVYWHSRVYWPHFWSLANANEHGIHSIIVV